MSAAFDSNLAALLARHRPVAADAGFRARLEQRFVAEAARLAATRRAAPPAPVLPLPRGFSRPALAAAAMLLVVLGAAWFLMRDEAARHADGGAGQEDVLVQLPDSGSSEHVVELPQVGAPGGGRDRLPDVVADAGAGPRALVIPGLALPIDQTPAAGVLTGRIVRDEDGSPVTVARLVLASTDLADPDSEDEVVDDPDGRFRWEDPPPGRYHLYVQAEGLAVHVTRHVRIDPGLMLPPLEIRMRRGMTVRGVVRDADTGAPVPGALVVSDTDAPAIMLALDGEQLPEVIVARTLADDEGRFELRDLSRGPPQVLRASASGRGPAWAEAGPDAGELEIRLPLGGAVEGQVWRGEGEPWEGAGLVASFLPMAPLARCMAFDVALSDAQGRYRMDDLPAQMGVVLLFEDFEAPTKMPDMQSMTVRAGASVRVDFGGRPATLGAGVIEGTLTEPGGRPAARRMISVMQEGCEDPATDWVGAMVADDGRWRVEGLAPGRYEIFLVLDAAGAVTRAGAVELPPNGGARLDLVLPTGALEGRVLRPDGAPLPHALVIVEGRETSGEWRFVGRNLTDDEGRWRAEALPPGLYRALGFDWQEHLGAVMSEQVVVGTEAQALDLQLLDGGRLLVSATDAGGRPLAGARVLLRDERGRTWSLSEKPLTGAGGTLLLHSVPAGRWEVEAVLAGHVPARTVVDVAAGIEAETRLTLPRAP